MASLRSTKNKTPRRKYTVDAFEGVEELQSAVSSDDEELRQLAQDSDTDEDEFVADADSPEPEDEEVSDLGKDAQEELSDQHSNAGERDLADNISIADSHDGSDDDGVSQALKKNTKGKQKKRPDPKPKELFNRAQFEKLSQLTGNARLLHLFGPSDDDYRPMRRALQRWGPQPCLPSRKAKDDLYGGFQYSDAYQEELRNSESNWKWYDEDGGKDALRKRQSLQQMTPDQVKQHLSSSPRVKRYVLMGPVSQPILLDLQVGQSALLYDAFKSDTTQIARRPPQYKNGFIFNLGARVHCLDWAPNQPGQDQYLAVSLLPKNRPPERSSGKTTTSAFAPQPPFKSSIAIWHFRSGEDGYIDTSFTPRTVTELCTSVGDIKTFQWCPVPAKHNDRLGLLGCITGDGGLSVFEIPLPTAETERLLVDRPGFQSKPPETVFTCMTWVGASFIAAGCANGFLALYDLEQAIYSANPNPRPRIYAGIAMTYIMSVSTCWPSMPHLLLATNMSGHISLTDLSDPTPASHTGTALSNARQIGQPLVTWHEFIHCGISAEDNNIVKAYPIRHIFGTTHIGKMRANCTSVATSLCHPFVLYGMANGDIAATNPIKRILNKKDIIFQQMWFVHEWRRPTEEEKQASEANAEEVSGQSEAHRLRPAIGKNGLTRITEGYKAQEMRLHAGDDSNVNHQGGHMFTTIFEEESAITALTWNSNIHVGGWAAAGMADGLLRVEDIAA